MAACHLFETIEKKLEYYDRRSGLSEIDYQRALEKSSTIYVGNSCFFPQKISNIFIRKIFRYSI